MWPYIHALIPPFPENTLELTQFFAPRIIFAIICGGIIGIERELKQKPAGIKTNIFICLGAAIFSSVGLWLSTEAEKYGGVPSDPSRMTAQIISGIGFLGGGVILKSGESIVGITTASLIWAVAAMGAAIGLGHPYEALAFALVMSIVLVLTSLFERKALKKIYLVTAEITLDRPGIDIKNELMVVIASFGVTISKFKITDKVVMVQYQGTKSDLESVATALAQQPHVLGTEQQAQNTYMIIADNKK